MSLHRSSLSFAATRAASAQRAGRWICMLLLWPVIAAAAYGQRMELVVSNRVGSTVDAEERAYFGLFAALEEFRSARFLSAGGDSVEIVVARQSRHDTSLVIPVDAFRTLGAYIDHYEGIFLHDTTIALQPIGHLTHPSKPFAEKGDIIVITTRDRDSFDASILFASDSFLLISDDPIEYIRHRDSSKAIVLLPGEIMHIQDGHGTFHLGLKNLDVPVEGNDTMYRQKVLGVIRRWAYYYSILPPEARELVSRRFGEKKEPMMPAVSMEAIYDHLRPIGLHLAAGYGLTVLPPIGNRADVERIRESRSSRDIFIPRDKWLGIGAEYDLLRWIRLGVAVANFSYPDVPTDKIADYDRLYGSQMEGSVKIVLPRRLLLGDWFGRFEVYGGLAFGRQTITVESMLASSFRPIPNTIQYTGIFHQDHVVSAKISMLGFAYYPVASFSIGLEGRMTTIDDIAVDEQVRLKDNGIYGGISTIDTHYAHTISQTYGDLVFVARANF